MYTRCLSLLVCFVLALATSATANAQSINYRGFARGTGTGFGCAFLPATNGGQAFVQNFTATYLVNGRPQTAQLFYGSQFRWNGNVLNWQVPYVGPNVVVTVTLDFAYTNNPRQTFRLRLNYVCPPNPNVGGWLLIPSC